MNKSTKWLIAVLGALTASSLLAMVYMAAGRADTDEEDQEEAVAVPSRMTVKDGRTIISLDAQTRAREGIRTAPVTYTSMRAQANGTAVVLAIGDLVTARNSYVAAGTKVERDEVAVNLSRTQYERVKKLYEANQNMSLKAMQEAEAAYRTNEAQRNADGQDADLQLDAVRQQWGQVIGDWVRGNGAEIKAVLEHREFLAQVTFPPGEAAQPPASLQLTLPGNERVRAKYVSPYPHVNPQIQGTSFLYVISGHPGIAAGMNLRVLVPVGRALRGAVIPESAVVSWRGKAWVYEAISPDSFSRREVLADNPVPGGYFVPGMTFASDVVTVGAQALLSEEFRAQIQQED